MTNYTLVKLSDHKFTSIFSNQIVERIEKLIGQQDDNNKRQLSILDSLLKDLIFTDHKHIDDSDDIILKHEYKMLIDNFKKIVKTKKIKIGKVLITNIDFVIQNSPEFGFIVKSDNKNLFYNWGIDFKLFHFL